VCLLLVLVLLLSADAITDKQYIRSEIFALSSVIQRSLPFVVCMYRLISVYMNALSLLVVVVLITV
jgi:hypothetical protein